MKKVRAHIIVDVFVSDENAQNVVLSVVSSDYPELQLEGEHIAHHLNEATGWDDDAIEYIRMEIERQKECERQYCIDSARGYSDVQLEMFTQDLRILKVHSGYYIPQYISIRYIIEAIWNQQFMIVGDECYNHKRCKEKYGIPDVSWTTLPDDILEYLHNQ